MKKNMLKLAGLVAVGLFMVGCNNSAVTKEQLESVQTIANNAQERAEAAYARASEALQSAQVAQQAAEEAALSSDRKLKRATQK